jgi:hypothetical protein
MPHKIKFPGLPAGIALTSAKKDEQGLIQTQGCYSTEDGQLFVERLEGLVQGVLNMVAKQSKIVIPPEIVHRLLLVVRKDLSASVYINDEVRMLATCDPAVGLVEGEPVSSDDIQSFKRLDFEGIELPSEGGVLFLFSVGWRKGLFFDYAGPADEDAKSNECFQKDFGPILGELMNRVIYQSRFKLTEDDWKRFFENDFFPFYGLRPSLLDKILAHIRSGWDLHELADKIHSDVEAKLPRWLEIWRKSSVLAPHIRFIEAAVDRYMARDFITCLSTLIPRLEGILRTHGLKSGNPNTRPASLAQFSDDAQYAQYDLLLPRMFKEYILKVFFRNFDHGAVPGDKNQAVSRNTVAHGIVSPDQCDNYQASVCFLVLYHLVRCIDPPKEGLAGPLVKLD